MNIEDTLDEMLRQLAVSDELLAMRREAVEAGNMVRKEAIEMSLDHVVATMEHLVDTMDDSDWDDVKEGVQLFFDEEDIQENWRTLGLTLKQYEAAQESGSQAMQAYLRPHIQVLTQKLRDMKEGKA